MNNNIIEEVTRQITVLPYDLRQIVLKELNLLSLKGVSGKNLMKYAGCICNDDLKVMRQAVESDCGNTDINEW